GSQRVIAVPPPLTTVGASLGAAAPTATLRSDSVIDSPRDAASAARPRSPADGYRSSGAFASALASTRSNSAGTPSDDGRGGGSLRWASIVAGTVPCANGGPPVSAANSTQPSEYTSARASVRPPRSCSGEQYSTVPIQCPDSVMPVSVPTRRVSPKSLR